MAQRFVWIQQPVTSKTGCWKKYIYIYNCISTSWTILTKPPVFSNVFGSRPSSSSAPHPHSPPSLPLPPLRSDRNAGSWPRRCRERLAWRHWAKPPGLFAKKVIPPNVPPISRVASLFHRWHHQSVGQTKGLEKSFRRRRSVEQTRRKSADPRHRRWPSWSLRGQG